MRYSADGPLPPGWTRADLDGVQFPVGFVANEPPRSTLRTGVFGGVDAQGRCVIRVTLRDGRKARTVRGFIEVDHGELVVRPHQRGKRYADDLRAGLFGWGDLPVRPRPSGRTRDPAVSATLALIDEGMAPTDACRSVAKGQVLAPPQAAIDAYGDSLQKEIVYRLRRRVDQLGHAVRARRATNATTNAEPKGP